MKMKMKKSSFIYYIFVWYTVHSEGRSIREAFDSFTVFLIIVIIAM